MIIYIDISLLSIDSKSFIKGGNLGVYESGLNSAGEKSLICLDNTIIAKSL